MKNTFKLIGIVAVIAIIGLSMVTCGDPGGGSSFSPPPTTPPSPQLSGTYITQDLDSGAIYRLVVTRPPSASVLSSQSNANIASASSANTTFTPSQNDDFTLTRTLGIIIETTTGKVSSVTGGNFALQSQGVSFTLVVNLSTGAITSPIPNNIPKDGGGTMTPAPNIGAFRPIFKDAQVYMWDQGELVKYTGSHAVSSYPPVGTGSISGGILNFTTTGSHVPAPDTLYPITDIFFDGNLNITVNPASAQATVLSLLAGNNNEWRLHYGDHVRNGNNFSDDYLIFLYVDRDCTTTIPGHIDGGNISWQTTTLQLKQGWNIVSGKISGIMGTPPYTGVLSVVNVLPPLKWGIEQNWDQYLGN